MIDVKIATRSRLHDYKAKLLLLQGESRSHHIMQDLPKLIPENALLVVNTAATIPASFRGTLHSHDVEVRLISNCSGAMENINRWDALIFDGGSWRDRTEDRKNPYCLETGDIVTIGSLQAKILKILHKSRRLVTIEFLGTREDIWNGIYNYGKPIQYSHLQEELKLWDVQTIFSAFPVSVEPASASFQFNWETVNELQKQGVEMVGITHATSVSDTGLDDIALPLPERYWISEESAVVIQQYHDSDRPIIAVGTSVTRALEDNLTKFGMIQSGSYLTDLKITASYNRKIVTALFTGMHLPEESHIQLLENFIHRPLLDETYQEAIAHNYLWHEYGDVNLIIP